MTTPYQHGAANARDDIAARIAVLEHKADEGKEERGAIKKSVESLRGEFSIFGDTLNGMREELARYRGFWGGAMLVIGALWAFGKLTWDWFAAQMK